MDKKWTKSARESDEYQNGLEFFLDFAYAKGKPCGKEIVCPCNDCYNRKWFTRNVVRNHLIAFGFQKGYDTWVRHGEKRPNPGDLNDNQMNHEDVERKRGRLHCHRRTTTPTLLKRNEEIAKLKREHADEVKQLIQEMEEKRRQYKESTDRKLQLLLKAIVSKNKADLDMVEALAALISAPTADANSVLRSSTSTHAPNDNQMMNNDDIDEEVQDFEDEEM